MTDPSRRAESDVATVIDAGMAAASVTPNTRQDRAPRSRSKGPRRRGMVGLAVGRLALLPVALFVVATVSFLLLHALPGDPAQAIAGEYATARSLRETRARLGLSSTLWHQYTTFLSGLVHGDLGRSYYSNASVASELLQRLPSTLELAFAALVLAVVWGVLLGALSAWFHERLPDVVIRAIVSVEQAVPDFVVALLLIFLLTFKLAFLPQPAGQLPFSQAAPPAVTHAAFVDAVLAGQWHVALSALEQLVLPAFSLGFVLAASFARISRSVMRSALAGEQSTFARSLGLRNRQVLYNAGVYARTPILTLLAILLGAIFGATAIIETIFSWNGVAQWGVQAITRHDIPAVLGFVLVSGFVTVTAYILLDLVVILLDPRLRER